MKLLSLYFMELQRLLLSKKTWAVLILCLLSPVTGYLGESTNRGAASMYIAEPVLAAAAINSIFWAVFAISQAGRLHRSGVFLLTDAAASPRVLSAARLAGMMTVSAASGLLCACLYLPYTAAKMEYLFDAEFYFANYLIFLVPGVWISILAAEAFYQITCRTELAAILYAALVFFGLSGYAEDDYFMRWLTPLVTVYSDGFTSWWFLRIGFYTRLLWLCAALGLWFVSMLCVRKYEKNIAVSFFRGMKKIYLPILAVLFTGSAAALWIYQPFIAHDIDTDEDIIIDTPVTQAEAIRYFLYTDPLTGRLSARAEYDVTTPYTKEDRLLLNTGYRISRMTYNGTDMPFSTLSDDIDSLCSTYFTIPENKSGTLVIEFEGFPQQRKSAAAFMIGSFIDRDSIMLGMRSSMPLLNYTCEDGSTAEVTIPEQLTLYLNDNPVTEYTEVKDGMKTWKQKLDEDSLWNVTAGRYQTDTFSAAGTKVHFVYGQDYAQAVDKYGARQAIIDVFEYCTKHYGKLWLTLDKSITLQQVSAMLMGGQARPGYLEWFETVLSPMTLADPAKGASATEVFIHEMIHQWWGGYGLSCSYDESAPFWSEEGLTVYSTYRLVKEQYGELYAKQYYVDEWKKDVQTQERNFYNRHPEYLARLPEKYQTQLSYSNEGINFYSRMPLMILKAEQLAGGEEKMDEILQNMYADLNNFSDTGFSYQDFLDYCGLTAEDLTLDESDYAL